MLYLCMYPNVVNANFASRPKLICVKKSGLLRDRGSCPTVLRGSPVMGSSCTTLWGAPLLVNIP